MKRFLIVLAVVLNLILLDAVTKELAHGYLGPGAPRPTVIRVIPGLFNLAYVENRGCAWGMFQGQVWPLALFGLVALGGLLWKRKSVFMSSSRLSAVAEPLLYAGILGNVIDRLFRGYVIDFFDFHWRTHHFPCFNLADSCICLAVGLLLLSSFSSKSS